MAIPKKFTLLVDHYGIPAGTTLYDFMGCDYGLASEDSRMFGYECVSMSLDPSGSPPSYTFPRKHLRLIVDEVTITKVSSPADIWEEVQQQATDEGNPPGSYQWWVRVKELIPIFKDPVPVFTRLRDGRLNSE